MKFLSKHGFSIFMVALIVFTVVFPEMALAANNAQQSSLKSLLSNTFFKSAIDLGLLIYAGYKWFMYFANFDPNSAFTAIIVPGVMTFLAFQWYDVLTWIKLV